MIIYELTSEGHEKVEDYLKQITFQRDKVFRRVKNNNELKLEYELENMPFSINRSHFSILLQTRFKFNKNINKYIFAPTPPLD